MKKVLIVIDLLKGFFVPGASLYCGDDSRKIIPYVKDLIDSYNREGNPVLFLTDSHSPDDLEFKMFPPHCVKGTEEAQIIDELRESAEKGIILPKTRFSGFYKTGLGRILAELKPDLVEVVGVCTNICVLYTVEGLRNRDYRVRVHRRGVATFDKEAHEFALAQMRSVLGAEIL